MFKVKNEPQYPWNEPEGAATYEYYTVASLGAERFTKDVNSMARRGWELVNGCMAGTAHYGYMRRLTKPNAADQAAPRAGR